MFSNLRIIFPSSSNLTLLKHQISKSTFQKYFNYRCFYCPPSLRMFIQTEQTPNENALKFKPGKRILPSDEVYEYTSYSTTITSPLARKLFTEVKGISNVFFGPDFVTVTKGEDKKWAVLKPEIFAILMDHLTTDQPVVFEKDEMERVKKEQEALEDGGQPEVVLMIMELLNDRIRPAIQEDGGDLEFMGFSADGTVKLKLKGSCRGCSSSSVTLKNGVENMLKHYISEVKKVEQVLDETEEVSKQEFEKLESKLNGQREDK